MSLRSLSCTEGEFNSGIGAVVEQRQILSSLALMTLEKFAQEMFLTSSV